MKTACLGKTWFSSYSIKQLLANDISVFFNCQCFTNRLISDFDFWHVDRYEWKEQDSLTGFLKKFSVGQMGHCMPKDCTSHNFGYAGRIFLKFALWKCRPWDDAQEIACARAVTLANQEKGGFGGRWKARPKVNFHGLISSTPNAK